MDMKFLQDLKENKHLSDMSQETIDFATNIVNKTSLRDIVEKHSHLFQDEEKIQDDS